MNFVAIDFETAATGDYTSICSVGAVKVVGGKVEKEFYTLVQPPGNHYTYHNILVHGIEPSHTEDALNFAAIWPQLAAFIGSDSLVAHNAAFERNCITKALQFYSLGAAEYNYICTYRLSGLSLDNCCRAYSVTLENHHNALDDARACAHLYIKMQTNAPADFSLVQKKTSRKDSYFGSLAKKKLSGSVLQKPDLAACDCESPFYGKTVVFTGDLSFADRMTAAEWVRAAGADVNVSIGPKTDIVITGRAPGPAKMEKVKALQAQGVPVQVMPEAQFAQLMQSAAASV